MKLDQLQSDFFECFGGPIKIHNPHIDEDFAEDQKSLTIRGVREMEEYYSRLVHGAVANEEVKRHRALRHSKLHKT